MSGSGAMAADRQIVRALVGLKVRLLVNGLRRSPGRAVSYVVGSLVALGFALGAATWLALLHGRPSGFDAAVVLTTTAALVWGVGPLVLFSTDETMDPQRLALLPLRAAPLLRGLGLSALLGPGPLVSLVLLTGAAVSTATDPVSLVVALVAVPLALGTLVALSRAVATGNARMLSSRRGRDLAVFGGLLFALGIQTANVAFQGLLRASEQHDVWVPSALAPLVSVLRWVPPASGVAAVHSAAEGHYGPAVLQLALTAGALALLVAWWLSGLRGLMERGDSSTLNAGPVTDKPGGSLGGIGRKGGPRVGRLLPRGRSGVVMWRQLLYMRREPRVRAALIGGAAVSVVPIALMSFEGHPSDYALLITGFFLCMQSPNLFGTDGSAFWMTVAATATAREARAELLGRVYALLSWGLPLTALVGAGLAALSDNWHSLPGVLGLTWGLFGCGIAVGALMSVLAPLALPADGNPMRNAAPGQTSTALASGCGTLFGSGLLFLPLGITAAVLAFTGSPLWVLLPLGIGYGSALCALAIHLAGRRLLRRLPEVLAAVSRH